MDTKALAEEFPREAVHWRVQGTPFERNGKFIAKALAYIDARDVMDRLDEVCQPENWQADYQETPSGRVICRIGIFIEDRWVWKSDGAGSTQVEGEKGGISDALKRAAVAWGIGRYLYRLDSPWVECEVNQRNGKTFWKRWTQDPWSKVKTLTYNDAAKAQKPPEEEKPKRDPKEIADSLIDVMNRAKTQEAFDKATSGERFKAARQWLVDEHPDHAKRVDAAFEMASHTRADPTPDELMGA